MNIAILTAKHCDQCKYSERGYYNMVCAHCPDCRYGKSVESHFVKRDEPKQSEKLKGAKE